MDREKNFFYGLAAGTFILLAVVLLTLTLSIISGSAFENKSTHRSDKDLSQEELLLQRMTQEKAASDSGFASQHRAEPSYPEGWRNAIPLESRAAEPSETKGFFYTPRKSPVVDLDLLGVKIYLSAQDASLLFGIITIILTFFTAAALSFPFIRPYDKSAKLN